MPINIYLSLIFILVIIMSGSVPHSIAVSSHTLGSPTTPGYTTYDLRSDEDTKTNALNARNAKASSDHIVTISEEGQALAQRDKKFEDVKDTKKRKKSKELLEMLAEEFIEDDLEPIQLSIKKESKHTDYQEKTSTGDVLDQNA